MRLGGDAPAVDPRLDQEVLHGQHPLLGENQVVLLGPSGIGIPVEVHGDLGVRLQPLRHPPELGLRGHHIGQVGREVDVVEISQRTGGSCACRDGDVLGGRDSDAPRRRGRPVVHPHEGLLDVHPDLLLGPAGRDQGERAFGRGRDGIGAHRHGVLIDRVLRQGPGRGGEPGRRGDHRRGHGDLSEQHESKNFEHSYLPDEMKQYMVRTAGT